MKLTTENIHKPCKVFDATGAEIPNLTECDTETGEVEQLVFDDDGQPRVEAGALVRRKSTRPAPLTVEWIE